jgi:hypothetical protein
MSRRSLLALLAIPAFLAAALTAVAQASTATQSTAPVVISVYPLKLKLGEKLTIHGRNFIKGVHKDTVVFMGAGKRVVWVKADKASTKTITVRLPNKLAVLLADKSGAQKPTRLQIRVIAKKSGRAFTKVSKSPVVAPNATIQTGTVVAEACPGVSVASGDSDGDMLSNGLELALGTNPCKADTDGDGVSDGYEYQSALDLNRNANTSAIPWPSPGKRPYPNPLDPSDANTDYDGDSLTLYQEYEASFAWLLGLDPTHTQLQTFIPYVPLPDCSHPVGPYPGDSSCLNNVMVVAYSDGDQTTNPSPYGDEPGPPTGPPAPTDPNAQSGFDVNGDGVIGDAGDVWSHTGAAVGWMNLDGNSYLNDSEKDVDGDGLSNYEETSGPMLGAAWWSSQFPADGTYPLAYAGTNWLETDTDGDTIPDGADDQDHDGYTNIQELSRDYVFPGFGTANVAEYNPCLPNDAPDRACMSHPPFNASFAPFAPGSTQPTWHTWPAP